LDYDHGEDDAFPVPVPVPVATAAAAAAAIAEVDACDVVDGAEDGGKDYDYDYDLDDGDDVEDEEAAAVDRAHQFRTARARATARGCRN
jgi:hypothetical protein